MSEEQPVGKQPCCSCWDKVAYAVPFVLIALLVLTYLVSSDFYLKYIISAHDRELQAVELVTFFSALIAAAILFYSTVAIFRAQAGLKPFMHRAFGIVAIIAVATLFFAGEEVNWGQTFFGWEVSQDYLEAANSEESNIHNRDDLPISVKTLASIFLISMFIVLPIGWRLLKDIRPAGWKPAIAEWPVVSCIVIAFLWKMVKDVYRLFVPEEQQISSEFYMSFVEQINEHKEMLVAVGILIYAVYRLKEVRLLKFSKG